MSRKGRFFCAVWFLAAGAALLCMQQPAFGQNPVLERQVVSLDGDSWQMACDAKNEGRDQAWYKAPVSGAKQVYVPSNIEEWFPGYHGVVWYWRNVDAPKNPFANGRYLLRFGVADYYAEVWVNGTLVGKHEGGETPFTLDATDAIKVGAANVIAVRVLNVTAEAIDGMALDETPHRNKRPNLVVGSMLSYGGLLESVDLLLVPAVRVDDVFVQADWKTGACRIQAAIKNTLPATVDSRLSMSAGPSKSSEMSAAKELANAIPPGDSVVEMTLQIPNHRLWQIEDPFLYRLNVKLRVGPSNQDEAVVRFGFRDFRVENGYFHLNGKRIFLKSSHTGNHCPVGQALPPREAQDLLRKDLYYMKSSGFNMIRFIAGVAHPYQLDLCDELGLMVYEENLAGWCLKDSPDMARRFDFSVREMILRDRNHPSVTMFGLLNETEDGPIVAHAVNSIKLVRELDPTRLILFQSGRWDARKNLGSVSNPGSTAWECQWGEEDPAGDPNTKAGWGEGGYKVGAGDAHVYPGTPQTPKADNLIRTLGADTKPVFLSEYGIGSLVNVFRELRHYEQCGIRADLEDVKYYQNSVDRLTADWQRFGLDGVYAFPEDFLRESQRLHARQRTLGFNLIRSNPKICGYNLTGLLDHGFTGEGLWSYWREWKPEIVDALQDGWAPLRWCLFATPMNGYVNKPIHLEAVLANEDVLAPGEYPVTLRVNGPAGNVWEKKTSVTVATGEGPLAIPVSVDEVTIDGPEGQYVFAANLERGGAPFGNRLKFYLSKPGQMAGAAPSCLAWNVSEPVTTWLAANGVACAPLEMAPEDTSRIILIGGASDDLNKRVEVMRHVARGGVALFLTPDTLKRGDNAVGWLPLRGKGNGYSFGDWLYHKECLAKPHAIFKGLPDRGIMDWDYYGPVIPHFILEGCDVPDEVAAVALAVCHSSKPDGYASGVLNGWYRFGAGWFMANSLAVVENLGTHPAADRLLLNMIACAQAKLAAQPAEAPGDFSETMKAVGYVELSK